MNRCRSCGLVIADHDTAQRRKWCGSMRRLILTTVQPEDYHRECFVNCILAGNTGKRRADRSVVARPAAHVSNFSPFSDLAFPRCAS